MYFYERGLAVTVGNNGALGGGLPFTLGGGIVVQLAEHIFLSLMKSVFFHHEALHLGTSISVLDMRTVAQQYGRPEKSLANIAMAQIARWLGATSSGHSGLSDAKAPSTEAGVQKATSAIFSAVSHGSGYVAAGLLGTDEIFSPVQMILDHDLVSSLGWISRGITIDDQHLALDVLLEEGPGVALIGTEHTSTYFRDSLWQPRTWSREMLGAWDQSGRQIDVDRARQYYLSRIHDGVPFQSALPEETEKRLMDVIRR